LTGRPWRAPLAAALVLLAVGLVLVAPAGADYRHPASSGSFGNDGTANSGFAQPQQLAINQSTNTLYLASNGEEKIFGFQVPDAATHTPVGGGFPIASVNGGGDGDLAADSATGNVYFVSEGTQHLYGYTSTGAPLPSPFPLALPGDNCGAAVDKEGNIWEAEYGPAHIQEYSPAGVAGKTIDVSATGNPCHFEFNRANNDLYVANYGEGVYKYTAASGYTVHTEVTPEKARGLAVDASTGTLYLTLGQSINGERVVAFNGSGAALETFGKTSSGGLRGIAVDEATGVVYVDNENSGKILVYPGIVVPDVTTGEPVGNNVVSGQVDPAGGGEVTSCKVEYGEVHENEPPEYVETASCDQPTPYATPTEVTAELPGLLGEHTYDYRFVASNSNPLGTGLGENRTITPHYVKALHTDAPSELSRNCATLNGSFEGNGEDTHYFFEYGKTTAYGQTSATPPGEDAGSGTTPVTESFHVCGLEPGTTYHYRVVASNGLGTSTANDQTFQTVTAVEFLTTEAATVPNAAEAVLHASYTGNGEDTSFFFEWGFTTFYGNKTTEVDEGSKTGPVAVSATIGELFPDTTYHFRVVAKNATGFAYGQDLTFTTGLLPEVSLLPPMSNERADGTRIATLRGAVNPKNGEATAWHFEYGPTTAYGSSTPTQGPLPVDESSHPVSAEISGLTPGVVYHYRLVATSKEGTTDGADATFQAVPYAPTVVGSSVSGVSTSAATVNATVLPGNGSTVVIVDYGTTDSYGSSTRAEGPVPADEAQHTVSRVLSGLQPNTTYHYRVTAVNFAGTSHGPDQTFSTAGVPNILAQAATGITQTEAELTASISPNLLSTTYHFEWGPKGSYGGASAESAPIGSDDVGHAVSARVTGLSAGTTYQFRVVATNALGSTAGSVATFTTAPAPAAKPVKCKKGTVLRKGKCVKQKNSKPKHHKKKKKPEHHPAKHKGAKQ
jgi:phosphodiesterase/alkaline phosphatase D-like protein